MTQCDKTSLDGKKWEHKKYRKENTETTLTWNVKTERENKLRERNVCSCMTGINEKCNNCQIRNRLIKLEAHKSWAAGSHGIYALCVGA
jgi:hypothetical protein